MDEPSDDRQLVVFTLGDEEYALPITRVQEIIFHTPPRAVTSDAPWVQGVISLRGKIIPVYDLASRLGVPGTRGPAAKIVIVETAHDRAGVIVDEVAEVLTVTASQLEPVPTADAELIESMAKIDDRLVVLLDLAGLFEAPDAPPVGLAPDVAVPLPA